MEEEKASYPMLRRRGPGARGAGWACRVAGAPFAGSGRIMRVRRMSASISAVPLLPFSLAGWRMTG